MIEKNTWVRIKRVILESSQRADRLPEETRKVPFVMWDTGYLLETAAIGAQVTIETLSGRVETGELVEANPQYELNYGDFVPELMQIGKQARQLLSGGENG